MRERGGWNRIAHVAGAGRDDDSVACIAGHSPPRDDDDTAGRDGNKPKREQFDDDVTETSPSIMDGIQAQKRFPIPSI